VPLVEQELVALPESINTTRVTSGTRTDNPSSLITQRVQLVEQELITIPESNNTTRATSGTGTDNNSRVY